MKTTLISRMTRIERKLETTLFAATILVFASGIVAVLVRFGPGLA